MGGNGGGKDGNVGFAKEYAGRRLGSSGVNCTNPTILRGSYSADLEDDNTG